MIKKRTSARMVRLVTWGVRAANGKRASQDAITFPAGGSKKALASIRGKIRRRLRPGNQAPWEEVVRALNRTVRGWAAYFSYGSVSKARHAVEFHVYHSVRAFVRRRHKVAGSGCPQFPAQRVFGELGVVSFDPTYRRHTAHASM